MSDKRLLTVVLVISIILAGCTSLTGNNEEQNEEEVPNQGLVIEEVTLDEKTLRENGGSTRAIMRGTNTNPTEVTDFSFQWSNTGILSITGPQQTSGLDSDCSGSVEGASQGVAPTFECIWEITVDGELRTGSSRTIPLTSLISYSSTLTSENEPIRIEFVEEAQNRESSARIDNREIRVSVNYPSQLYTDMLEGEGFEIGITVQNIGGGEVTDREVTLTFSGGLADEFSIPDRCGEFEFTRGSNKASRTCELSVTEGGLSVTEGDYMGMDIEASYGYELRAEHPVTVEAR